LEDTKALVGYEAGAECSICKGRCCRERGCSLSPEDLTEAEALAMKSEESLIELLENEDCLYAIDTAYYGDGSFYYLRMKSKCYTFIGIEGYGECIALTEEGCSLDFSRRPKGGRSLKSSPDFRCRQQYSQEDMVLDWKPYQEVLARIWNKYSAMLEADGTIEKCEKAYEMLMRERMKLKKNGM